ncbi:L,D-transpeptidase [Phormidium tenue FACHB-886]|nr:L,D-transpeptidase [Phormidium tenue FACHB-886]
MRWVRESWIYGVVLPLSLLPLLGQSAQALPAASPTPNAQLEQTPTPPLPPLGNADVYLPKPDPLAFTRLQIRLSERRVYVYHRDQVQTSFPVAIGRAGWETPTGSYHVLQKIKNPAWEHPFTGEVVPPGADNPLGTRWIGFWTDGRNFIGFHGTPNEESVGTPASHGCIRMYDRDVTKLFEMVRLGTPVEVVR